MKIVFFATPDYVLPILNAVHKNFKTKNGESPIAAVVTQKPKPAGRKQFLEYSPIDTWAHKRNLPKFYCSKDFLESGVAADLGILAAYSEIIPRNVIEKFRFGILNIHPSLLPKYRGASPVQATIASGETQTGVSIIKIDEKLDHGPIVTQFKEELLPEDTAESLRNRLFEKSAEVLVQLIPAYLNGKVNLKNQDEKGAIYTREINKDDGFIPPDILASAIKGGVSKNEIKLGFIDNQTLPASAKNLFQFIKALTPWPGVWSEIELNPKIKDLRRLKIIKAHPDENEEKLIIDEVQLEGKNPVSWKQFCEGYPTNSLSNLE